METSNKPAALTPRGLDRAAAFSWRLLLIGAAVVALIWLLAAIRPVVIAVVFALFLTALLAPVARTLDSRTPLGRTLAALVTLAGAVAAFIGLWVLLVPSFVDQLTELGSALEDAVDDLGDWLGEGPLDLSQQELDDLVNSGYEQLREHSGGIASGFFSGALLALEIIGAVLLGTIAAFFLIRDGEQIWAWIVSLFGRAVRPNLNELGTRSWSVVGGYLRGVTIVATFDAVFIGLALVLLGVPAALPLAVLTFFGAYIPFAGAVVTGMLAALVALAANGIVVALIVVAAVIVVQQTESNILYPLVVGQTVHIHPLAALLAVTIGAVLAGILGAIIAIPITAAAGQALAYSRELRDAADEETGKSSAEA
jgi:putative heme transporter